MTQSEPESVGWSVVAGIAAVGIIVAGLLYEPSPPKPKPEPPPTLFEKAGDVAGQKGTEFFRGVRKGVFKSVR